MPGLFSEESRPKLPGIYHKFEAVKPVTTPPALGSIVALPFTHDWGPSKSPRLVLSMADWDDLFGATDTVGRRAAYMAFRGEDVEGVGGAGALLCYRMLGTAGAKATRTLNNTTPAVALTLSGKYEGVRGNDLRVTVQDKAGDATKTELIILLGTVEVERYEFLDADINDAAAKINLYSKWATAVANINGVALAVVSAVAFSGGNDGSTLVAGEWTAMLTALEVERFSIFVPFDLTDAAILASIKTWVTDQNNLGRRFRAVVGGALDETVTTAIARSTTLNSEHFVNVGGGSIRDLTMLDAGGTPRVLSSSQAAPRIAGALAARGMTQSLTFARFAGWEIVVGIAQGSLVTAYDGGVVVLARDSDSIAPVHVVSGITTYTTKTDTAKPYDIFKRPKNVAIMGGYEMTLTENTSRKYVGRLTVNRESREAVAGDAIALLRDWEAAKVVQPGWSVAIPADASDDLEYIDLLVGLRFGRSMEQIFFITRVG